MLNRRASSSVGFFKGGHYRLAEPLATRAITTYPALMACSIFRVMVPQGRWATVFTQAKSW